MIDEEQKKLSDYIKSVHLSLRCKSRRVGAELAWKQHVENEKLLQNYAVCMKKLAQNYWSVNNAKDGEKFMCRIQWMLNTVREYFQNGGLETEIAKEKKRTEKFVLKLLIKAKELEIYQNFSLVEIELPYKVLDVGSCYDPFSVCDLFKTFPIDLCPASSSVVKCDFTKLKIDSSISTENSDWFRENLEKLPENFFDVVVFSLFLEYLPLAEQRYFACSTAYETLKINGLLLIATPDSKHESANAGIMKSWKIALAQVGFVRIKLEKLKYLYCMAFRKAISKNYPSILYNIRESNVEKLIKIPQDYVNYEVEKNFIKTDKYNEANIREAFEELPFS